MTEGSQHTILVVDDDPVVAELISSILRDIDAIVMTAGSGYDAVELLAQERFEVVITDIRMDGMSGFDLLSYVKQLDATIKVIMMTGADGYDVLKQALKGGVYDYFNKPITDHEELTSTVIRALEEVPVAREKITLVERLQISNAKANIANERLLKLNKQLRKLATTDSLTDLHNRRYIDDWIQDYEFSNFSHEKNYSVVLLDVDHFKAVNDSCGHESGDKVLSHIAGTLKNISRSTDLVGRYGGEEFIIVMPDTSASEALVAAERIRATIEAATIPLSCGVISITASLGISTNKASSGNALNLDRSAEEASLYGRMLLAEADKALYAAKDGGRNMCLHHNSLPTSKLSNAA